MCLPFCFLGLGIYSLIYVDASAIGMNINPYYGRRQCLLLKKDGVLYCKFVVESAAFFVGH